MKKSRCKHDWVFQSMLPEKLRQHDLVYNCYFYFKCSLCSQEKTRQPTSDEFKLEREKQFCKFCGEHISMHDVNLSEVSAQTACMRILFERIRRLEERLENASVNI